MKKNKAIKPVQHFPKEQRIKRMYLIAAITMAVFCFPMIAYAADPALDAIGKLSDFIFAAIKAIGFILLGFGVVQIGMSLKSHDPSQRSNGFLTFFGGLIIAFAQEILQLIGVQI